MTYTLAQIRQAGKEGEVNHLDVEHIIDLLKEQPNANGQKEPLYRWVRASERLPPMETVIYLRRNGVMDLGNFYEQDQCYFLYIQRNGAHDEYTLPYSSPVNGDLEWLCKVETPEQDESYPIEFIEWLSGQSEYLIKDSYERYKMEIEKGQP